MENALLILTVSPNPKEKYPSDLKLNKRTWIIGEFSEYPHIAEESAILSAIEYVLHYLDYEKSEAYEKAFSKDLETLEKLNMILNEKNWHVDSKHEPWISNPGEEHVFSAEVCFKLVPMVEGECWNNAGPGIEI
jgi:hypothetical protein